MGGESGVVIVDLIKEELAGIRAVDADIELVASRLIAKGRRGILSHQAHEALAVTIDQQIDGDDQARVFSFRHR